MRINTEKNGNYKNNYTKKLNTVKKKKSSLKCKKDILLK